MQLNEAVSRRLVELMQERGMTQYQLYMKSGVPKSTIGNLVNCAYSALTSSSHASAARSAAFLAFAGVKSAGAVQVVYFLICLPRTSRSKQTVKRKEITLPFFLFSRMFAIETHPFISDVSMTFTRDFRCCALFCALLEFLHICAPRVLLLKVAKKP